MENAAAVENVVAPSSKEIKISPDQLAAVNSLLDFIADPDPKSPFFVFKGSAGTGKTFCMREVLARTKKSKVKFAFTAPTNKAAKELRAITGNAGTIFSLLGLRIDKSGEVKALVAGKAPNDLSELDVIFIDEASMINRQLKTILEEAAVKFDLKVVFMGDAAQLPPVGESESPVWKLQGSNATLTKVMRHDNQILNLVTEIRGQIESLTPSVNLKSDNANGIGVWKVTKAQFKNDIYNAACEGVFGDGVSGKVIAWRNATVEAYNEIIRRAIFGAAAMPGNYMKGERIVAAGPCLRADELLLSTDDEALVESTIDCTHPIVTKYKAIELFCRNEMNKAIRLLVLHPDSKQQFADDSTKLAHDAKANPKLWKKFWEHKELFHDIKYGYALTTHRSQGSTYKTVFVDYQDILLNRNRREAFQCLYVACSRPTTQLIIG